MVVVVVFVMRLLMGMVMGGMTRRVVISRFVLSAFVLVVVMVLVGMRKIIVVFMVVHGLALLKRMEMLKRCQTRLWRFILLTV